MFKKKVEPDVDFEEEAEFWTWREENEKVFG